MKLSVVVEGFSYEGYDTPFGIFSTRELAEAAQQELRSKEYHADFIEVVEYELDKPEQSY